MNCLPTDTQKWLLRAALQTDLQEGYQAFLTWQNATDFEGPLLTSEMLLIPLIWQKYKSQLIENPNSNLLGGLYKKSFYTNSHVFHQLPLIADVFEKRGFNYAFTKGIALHCLVYSDSSLRPMNDIDILIAQTDFVPAVHALQQIGYYAKQPNYSIDMYTTGQLHAFVLIHDTLNSIVLYYFPSPLHNQKLTNQPFLDDAQTQKFRGIQLRLLTPEKLALFLLLNYQFTADWHWPADVVSLHKKYGISLHQLRSLVTQTGLYHSMYEQLNFLWTEYGIGSSEELGFYLNQPYSLADKYVVESKHVLDLKWRIALIAGKHGLTKKKGLSLPLVYHLLLGGFRAMKRTPRKEVVVKSVKLLQKALKLS